MQYFELLKMDSTKAEEISASIQLCCWDVQQRPEDINTLKSALSESQKKYKYLKIVSRILTPYLPK
jgi:hypothetical protein